MKFFSLFSGIGGFELGIKKAYPEAEFIGYSEINKPAISVYERHFPGTKNFGSVDRISTRTIPDFDVLTFGWPCQDNSIAGKRQGQKRGTRSGLLFEAVRILRAKKPKYFIAENVTGLFSVNEGSDFYEALRLFTDAGYEYQWQVLNTRWFLPQNRERIFIVGHLRGQSRPEIFPIGEDGEAHFYREGGAESKAKPASAIATREGGRKNNNFVISGELNFIGAVMTEKNKKWLEDGNSFSRNFPQGQRIYDIDGIATTQNSNGGGAWRKDRSLRNPYSHTKQKIKKTERQTHEK